VSLLTSIFYLGIFIGCLVSGNLADKYGRKRLIIIGAAFQFFFSLFFLFANSYIKILINRFFYGLAFGVTIVLTTSMYAESAPIKYRGKGLLFLNFCVSLGKFYGVILAYIFL
jgi:MFS family permease